MPDATKFESEGVDNGFAHCLDKIDVSDWTYVRPMTLAQASKLYWNLYGATSSASINDPAVPPNYPGWSESVSNPNMDTRLDTGVDENPSGYQVGDREPRMRVCPFVSGYIEERPLPYENVVRVEIKQPWISRLYDGITTDEDNFIGYGCREWFAMAFAGVGYDYTSFVALYSIGGEDGDSYRWPNLPSGLINITPDSVENVTFDGIPLIRATWESVSIAEVSITGLDFYTYT